MPLEEIQNTENSSIKVHRKIHVNYDDYELSRNNYNNNKMLLYFITVTSSRNECYTH